MGNVIMCAGGVSILPRLATGIASMANMPGSICFYSSPSCDGDHLSFCFYLLIFVSILPRLATGIMVNFIWNSATVFLFFPVLRRGSMHRLVFPPVRPFLFFPVLRRGSRFSPDEIQDIKFLFFPVLRRGSESRFCWSLAMCFYSSPSCDGDHYATGRTLYSY